MEITRTASREEWLAARLDLLADKRAAGRQLAALAEQRRALPAVAVDKDCVFEGPNGKVALIDLFEGRSQLIVYHFMRLHDIDEGCPSCSFAVDDMPDPIHLNQGADTALVPLARVPYDIVQDGGKVFRTYSAYGVGADVMLSTQRFLDLTPLGRQRYINEWPWHDTYGAPDRHEYHH